MSHELETLLRGQRNLDRMRRDIRETLDVLLSHVALAELQRWTVDDCPMTFDAYGRPHRWVFRRSGASVFSIECLSIRPSGAWRGIYATQSNVRDSPPLENVQEVWEALPLLLAGFRERSLISEAQLAPYLNAAKVVM